MKITRAVKQIELTIKKLSLSGFNYVNRAELAAVVQQELTNILSKSNPPVVDVYSGKNTPSVDSISTPVDVTSKTLGARIAHTVHQEIISQPNFEITASTKETTKGQQIFSSPSNSGVLGE